MTPINNCIKLCFCLFLGILPPLSILAQIKPPPTTATAPPNKANIAPTAYLRLATGEELMVKILSKDSSSVQVLVVSTDELRRIELSDLVAIRAVASPTRPPKDYTFSTRNGFSNTALGLKKGESFYQNAMLGYNAYHYGITDHLTLGGGTELFTLFEDPILPVWAHLKYTYKIHQFVHVGLNFLGLRVFDVGDRNNNSSFLAAWGNVTLGDHDNNLTAGWGRQGDDFDGFFANNMVQVSGQLRMTKRWTLMGGFWEFKPRDEPAIIRFFPQETRTHLYSVGFRYAKGHSAWELSGLHCPLNRSFLLDRFTVPVLSYVRRW